MVRYYLDVPKLGMLDLVHVKPDWRLNWYIWFNLRYDGEPMKFDPKDYEDKRLKLYDFPEIILKIYYGDKLLHTDSVLYSPFSDKYDLHDLATIARYMHAAKENMQLKDFELFIRILKEFCDYIKPEKVEYKDLLAEYARRNNTL